MCVCMCVCVCACACGWLVLSHSTGLTTGYDRVTVDLNDKRCNKYRLGTVAQHWTAHRPRLSLIWSLLISWNSYRVVAWVFGARGKAYIFRSQYSLETGGGEKLVMIFFALLFRLFTTFRSKRVNKVFVVITFLLVIHTDNAFGRRFKLPNCNSRR